MLFRLWMVLYILRIEPFPSEPSHLFAPPTEQHLEQSPAGSYLREIGSKAVMQCYSLAFVTTGWRYYTRHRAGELSTLTGGRRSSGFRHAFPYRCLYPPKSLILYAATYRQETGMKYDSLAIVLSVPNEWIIVKNVYRIKPLLTKSYPGSFI